MQQVELDLILKPTGPADWLLTFRSVRQELRNPSLGNRETRGGWLVREAALQSVTMSLCEDALQQLVDRGVLCPVRYAPVAGPLFAPDPGRGCATKWPPFPRDEPRGWEGRISPRWAWVYRVSASLSLPPDRPTVVLSIAEYHARFGAGAP
jgi:hypothetical protein